MRNNFYSYFIGVSSYAFLAPKILRTKIIIRRTNIANKIHCIKPEGKKLLDPKIALEARLLALLSVVDVVELVVPVVFDELLLVD